MIVNVKTEIIEAFDKIRKIYLLEKFENLSESTEDILKNNLNDENYLMEIKSTIELIIESKFEERISDFEDLLDLPNFKEELGLIKKYVIELLKGDPDVECIKSYIIFNVSEGLLKFGWNHSIFKRDIDLIVGLFTAITSFSQEAVERQLKGLSVEGMEFEMIPFKNSNLAVLFILSRTPSVLLVERMNQFRDEIEKEMGDLFVKMQHIDFTNDDEIKDKIRNLMVKILKFDLDKLIEMNNN